VQRPLGRVSAVAAIVLVAAATASAATIRGTARADRLAGTPAVDAIQARGGDDRIVVQGDAVADSVSCGRGRDVVTAELVDRVAADCEVVSRQLSRDPGGGFAQHETEVEPDSFSVGSTIVTAFQAGRFTDGGAEQIGWATSANAGVTWRSGFLPDLTIYSSPAADRVAVSDPVVAFDAVHGFWLIASLGLASNGTELLVSRSRDGVTWSRPVVAGRGPAEDHDKEWLVCDGWRTSPFRGNCYLSYLDGESGEIRTRSSGDGGATWTPPVGVPGRTDSGVANGAQPVIRPDGSLVVVFAVFAAFASFADPEANQLVAVRSTDGGRTFTPRRRIARLDDEDVQGMRADSLPNAEVDGAGTIWLAWGDCRFREACLADDVVLARSTDGVGWSAPVRVPAGPVTSNVQYFLPGLGVDPTRSGRLAVAYHSLPQECGPSGCAGVDVWLIRTADGGRTWSRPQRLTAQPMRLEWLADTGIGRFLGDYVSTSFVGGRPVPVFSLAGRPVRGEFRQAIVATTKLVESSP
jgi:hypothetical protein